MRAAGASLELQGALLVSPGFPALPMQFDRQVPSSVPKLELIFHFIRLDHLVAAITARKRPIPRRQTLEVCAGKNFELKLGAQTRTDFN